MYDIKDKISEWIKNKAAGPLQVQIHLTNFCNLKCFFCPTRSLIDKNNLNSNNELTKEVWLKIIEDANQLGVEEWHICGGGEPFFFKEKAVAVINKIKDLDKYCEIITNGTLFTENMIKNFIDIEVDKITFSLDGSNAKIHESLRGVKCFDTIINNLKRFRYWKIRLNKNKPRIAFHFVLCNKNYKDLINIMKLAKRLGVEDVMINALNIWAEEIKKLELSNKQRKELKKILIKASFYAKRHSINTNINEFIQLNLFDKANKMDKAIYNKKKTDNKSWLNIPCYIPWYNMSIFANGECKPCFILKKRGSSLKEESLKSIWLGDFFNKIRQEMKNNKINEDCSKCNPWSFYKNKEIKKELEKIL